VFVASFDAFSKYSRGKTKEKHEIFIQVRP